MKKAVSEFLQANWLNVLESIDEAMIVVNHSGAVEFMNETAAALTGLSAARTIGTPAAEAFRANPSLLELIEAHETRLNALHVDSTLLDRLQHEIPVHAATIPLRAEDGTPIGTLLTLQDRSHQRELEARTREVERLGELETLVAGLAHEIRNPLSGMRGAAQLLAAQPGGDARTEECTAIVVEEIDRLEALLSQLLELSGAPKAAHASVNIHKLLDHVIGIETAKDPNLKFERQYDPSLPEITGDSNRLVQVLLNLVRNAHEVTPPGGTITLLTKLETTYRVAGVGARVRFLSVEVRDQGGGIADGDLERIFAPFFTTKTHGTGLGLAVSQRIVSEHGGILRARNEPGVGAVFSVTLPVTSGAHHGS